MLLELIVSKTNPACDVEFQTIKLRLAAILQTVLLYQTSMCDLMICLLSLNIQPLLEVDF